MPSSTSSSDARFLALIALTFGVLVVSWELVLRSHASATIDYGMERPKMDVTKDRGERWVLFGNCLVMTGIEPTLLNAELGEGARPRSIANIAEHEQSPIAFFEYLRRSNYYPEVVVANVSSWLNGTNFDQEAIHVEQRDPLQLMTAMDDRSLASPASGESFHDPHAGSSGGFQRTVENDLSAWTSARSFAVGHRYHLFDYAMFLESLIASRSLDDALYQLNMQSWFRVRGGETDGRGWLGLKVEYRADWAHGVDRMADRSVQRLRLSRTLTPTYWERLDRDIRDFKAHGTKIVLVRMPEHAAIHQFNDETYALTERLKAFEEKDGTATVDVSNLGPQDGVRLFNAVHPDAESALVITREIAARIRERGLALGRQP